MKTKMIFNLSQANLFIQNGCKVVGVGTGRHGKIYLLFEVDATFEKWMEKWNNYDFKK